MSCTSLENKLKFRICSKYYNIKIEHIYHEYENRQKIDGRQQSWEIKITENVTVLSNSSESTAFYTFGLQPIGASFPPLNSDYCN